MAIVLGMESSIEPQVPQSAPSSPIPSTCPRCGSPLGDAEFYGVCATCASELRATYSGEARDVQATEYEPKMNVTPNAVALKE